MGGEINERVLEEARYIIETGATVRATAKVFSYSKSTVHKDVSERLFYINKRYFRRVKKVLEKNLSERHIRGGEATRRKFLNLKKNVDKK